MSVQITQDQHRRVRSAGRLIHGGLRWHDDSGDGQQGYDVMVTGCMRGPYRHCGSYPRRRSLASTLKLTVNSAIT
jgi:hypothetical protein